MNEEEKKTIEDINGLITIFETDNGKDFEATCLAQKEIALNLKTILNLIEKLQKENEYYKECLEVVSKHLDNIDYDQILFAIYEYYISKQKVKDKIEEILNNKEYRIVFEGDAEFPDDATIINAQKYIKLEKMQELIEEREVKEYDKEDIIPKNKKGSI